MTILRADWQKRLMALARRYGTVEPCSYQVAVGSTDTYALLKVQENQGPYVCLQMAFGFAGVSAASPRYFNISADARRLNQGPVSNIALGLFWPELSVPAPIYLGESGCLTIERIGAGDAGGGYPQDTVAMAGFHCDAVAFAAVRSVWPELRTLSVGGYQRAAQAVDGYGVNANEPILAAFGIQPDATEEEAEVLLSAKIDSDFIYRQQGVIDGTLSAFFNINAPPSTMIDRIIRSDVSATRDGASLNFTQTMEFLGSALR